MVADSEHPTADGADDELALQKAVELAFGAGAYSLIHDDEPSSADSRGDASHDAAACAVGVPPVPEQHIGTDVRVSSRNEKLLLFELEGGLYSVPISSVLEIQRAPEITTLPRTPSWLRGIANLRGSIISIVDLRCLLGMKAGERDRYVIIVRSHRTALITGLLVNRVLGFRALDVHGPTDVHSGSHCVIRVANLQDQTVAVLDVECLLQSTQTYQPPAEQA